MAKIHLQVRNEVFLIDVNEKGWFTLDTAASPAAKRIGYVGRFDTLEALRLELMKQTKRQAVKLDIQATLLDRPEAMPVRVVSRNLSSGKLIVRTPEGREECDFFTDFYRPLTDEETAEYARLHAARKAASAAFDAFKVGKKINVRKVVEAEQKKLDDAAAAAIKAELEALRDETDAADGATNADECCGPVDDAANS